MTKKEIKNYAKEHNCSIREAQRQLNITPTGKFNDSVEKENGLKKVKLSEIKTPTTVEEFRDNLKKYFAGIGEDALYVQETNMGIKYEDINSFDDIYKATGMGFGNGIIGQSPSICPLIEYDTKQIFAQWKSNTEEFRKDNSNWLWFHDDYEVYESRGFEIDYAILTKMKNPMWFTLDNKVLREFYMHVLGEYAGYGLLSDHAPKKVA